MTKSQNRNVNKLYQQMIDMRGWWAEDKWWYGQSWRSHEKNDVMEKYWKSAKNEVIENHKSKNY